jgi:threonine dehydratase
MLQPSNTQIPTIDDIRTAAQRIDGAVLRTPMMISRTLSEIVGAEIWLKFENLQFTAAYKERGALNKLLARHSRDHRQARSDSDGEGHADRRAWRGGRAARRNVRRRLRQGA